ncbi:MAG TPA: GGDEF domain-containing protein [Chitinivibrionales bacterium]|jgi:diguanylate cyclase (GGDEF)-like protein|nr:GGDEF domain-containing protein [Chitinivibrionales bacterium]
MSRLKENDREWGLGFYLSAVVCAGAAVVVAGYCPYSRNRLLYTAILPWTGLAFSLAAFFAGHFSYPRVHNVRVYLAGYLTCLFGIAYFVLYRFVWGPPLPKAGPGYAVALYVLMLVNCYGILFLSKEFKYRDVRRLTLAIVTVEGVLVLVARLSPQVTEWVQLLDAPYVWDPRFFAGALLFAGVAIPSVLFLKKDFFLGGLLAGWAVFFAPAWISRLWGRGVYPLEIAEFTAMPVYLTICVIVHWFMRMDRRISYDPLLHIYNRDYCSKIISEQSSIDTSPPFAVAMVDIDHFKNVNDTYGHQAGDQVLYAVAQAIQNEVVPAGTLCRYGGEEMVVFFPQIGIREAEPVIERVRKSIETLKVRTRNKTLSVKVSCGISARDDISQSVIDVIHTADKALYKAKKEGRNQVRTAKTPLESARKK